LLLHKSVAEIGRMSARERDEWIAYFELKGMPDPLRQTALVCAVIANANRVKGPPAKVEDFMPKVRRPEQDAGQMMDTFLAFAGG
jgi:hypothetical protein